MAVTARWLSTFDPRPAGVGDLLTVLGGTAAAVDGDLPQIAGAALARGLPLLRPRVAAVLADVAAVDAGGATLGAGARLQLLGRFLAGAPQVCLAVATVGPELEAAVAAQFAAGEVVEGLFLDAVANLGLWQAEQAFRAGLGARFAGAPVVPGATLEPGCGAVALANQRTLFDLVDPAAIGVTLNDSLLMTPRKSVSWIIPVGPPGMFANAGLHRCDICNLRSRCHLTAAIRQRSGPSA